MSSDWTPSRPYQPGDRIILPIKPEYAFERWTRKWVPPLRPLLRRLRDRREEIPVEAVITTAASSGDMSGNPFESPEPPAGPLLRWSTRILWWLLVAMIGLPAGMWLVWVAFGTTPCGES